MGVKIGKHAELVLLSVVFFTFMIAHEVVIEGMWESFKNIPDGIALYITLFQFTFVGVGALTVEALLPTASDSASAGTQLHRDLVYPTRSYVCQKCEGNFVVKRHYVHTQQQYISTCVLLCSSDRVTPFRPGAHNKSRSLKCAFLVIRPWCRWREAATKFLDELGALPRSGCAGLHVNCVVQSRGALCAIPGESGIQVIKADADHARFNVLGEQQILRNYRLRGCASSMHWHRYASDNNLFPQASCQIMCLVLVAG
eukprot:1186391-Prorocentrum_minimum.AAC.6